MNRELFDNAKALVESRKIEAVEVALQTVYNQGTDAQKAEIEEMAVVLMMVNRHNENIEWALNKIDQARHNQKVFLLQSAATLLLKTSSQSLFCSVERIQELWEMWRTMQIELEHYVYGEPILEIIDSIQSLRALSYYDVALRPINKAETLLLVDLDTKYGVVETNVPIVIKGDYCADALYLRLKKVINELPRYMKSNSGIAFRFEPAMQFGLKIMSYFGDFKWEYSFDLPF